MPSTTIEQRALSLMHTFESAGKQVSRVTIEGRRIEIVLSDGHIGDEYSRINMRYDKA